MKEGEEGIQSESLATTSPKSMTRFDLGGRGEA